MKADSQKRISTIEDDFWTEHVQLFTAQFPSYYTKPQKVWGRFHISEETYHGSSQEIIPISEGRGKRTYVMMQPYVLEPKLTITVGLYTKPKHYADQNTAIGETIGQPKQQGFREVQTGNAQAWYYHTDKTIVLWECFFESRFRRHPLPEDANMQKFWKAFEHWLIKQFPQAKTLATPFNDPIAESIEEYQAFLKSLGYTRVHNDLNQRSPCRCQADAKVMQRTANFHHHVANPSLPDPDRLFEHAAALHAAIDMFDTHAPPRELPIPRFLCPRQLVPTGLLRGLEDVHAVQREGLKAQILQQLTPRRQRIRRGVGDVLVMDTARMRLAQEKDAQGTIDQEQVLQHVPLFLAAITRFLFSRVVGARDGSLGAVMTKRGTPGGGAPRPSSVGGVSCGRDGPSTPKHACKASTRREGASPKVRRVWRNTGSKT
jgi:hypothetical protein